MSISTGSYVPRALSAQRQMSFHLAGLTLVALSALGVACAGLPAQVAAHPDTQAEPRHDTMAAVRGGRFRSILPTGTARPDVTVAPFRLDRLPVTNAQFLQFVSRHAEWRRGRVPAVFADEQYLRHWQGPLTLGPGIDPQQPVTSVSWFAARAYCEARGTRLPEWYEWEFAAAADETRADARDSAEWQQRILAWYSRPSSKPPMRVGESSSNVYGVSDLHGLIWEWVDDFNALMVSDDSREQGAPKSLEFCGSGALAFESRDQYAIAMRIAMLSSLQGRDTTVNVGFRCATR